MIQKIKIAASRFLSKKNIHAPVDAFIMSYEKVSVLKHRATLNDGYFSETNFKALFNENFYTSMCFSPEFVATGTLEVIEFFRGNLPTPRRRQAIAWVNGGPFICGHIASLFNRVYHSKNPQENISGISH